MIADRIWLFREYEIELVEDEQDQANWKAHIRRHDGKLISTQPGGKPGSMIVSNSYPSSETAFKEAKRVIAAGGITAVAQ